MSSYNKVLLMGNVTREPVLTTTKNGQKITELGLAINRTYIQNDKKVEETTFVDITFWNRTAETICKHVQKGIPIFVEGRLKLDSWTDDSGNKKNRLRVTGESFQFVGKKADNTTNSSSKHTSHEPCVVNESINDDDIPF